MKLRLFTGLALALTLGGCTTYGYVDDGGGYYSGAPQTQYRYYGNPYGPYGPYAYDYGSSYYSPGVSFGLSYGYPYRYYQGGPYRYPYYGYGGSYYPRPPYNHSPRPDHGHGRPDRPDHGGRPDRPPMAEGNPPPPLNRGPWRDLERLRRAQQEQEGGPRRQPVPGARGYGATGPDPAPGMTEPGMRPGGNERPMPPPGYRMSGARPGNVMGGGGNDMSGRRMATEARAERVERAPQRSESRASQERRDNSPRSGTPDTIEP